MTATRDTGPTAAEIRERGGLRRLTLFGPAFVAAIAYVDPGNFATNFSAGAEYGYLLLWMIIAANLLAMLIQTLSAKLGLATGRNLPELSLADNVWISMASRLAAMITQSSR